MSSSFDPAKDLEQLLMDLVDGELSYVQQQHLAALLRDNPTLQKQYQDYLLLDALLHWEQPEPVPHSSPDSSMRPRFYRRWGWLLAGCVLLALGFALVHRWTGDSKREGSSPSTAGLDLGATEPQATGVAVLRRYVQVQWEPDSPRFGVGATIGVGPLRLKTGLVQLEFYSGATVVVEGPASLEILAADRFRIGSGKLRAIVPQSARGFTILSSAAELVDLGTEFGLEVSPSGRTQVHVFQGKVEVYKPDSQRSGDSVQSLVAGQGLQVDSEGRRVGIPANGRIFLSREEVDRRARLEEEERRRQWQKGSEQLRRDPRLLAYYSFQNRSGDGRTLSADNPAKNGLDGAIIGCEWVSGRWRGKRALEFKRPGDRVRLTIPGQYEALTFMAWVRVDALEQRFNGLFLTDGFELRAPHWQITQEGKIRLGIRNGAEPRAFQNYDTKVIFTPEELGQWKHLATVYDAAVGRMAHYVDGQCVVKKTLRGERVSLSIGNAEIGNWGTPGYGSFQRYPIRNFNGRIDEFALFQAPLSDRDIQELYRMGEPNP
jgi:hypothetical protein